MILHWFSMEWIFQMAAEKQQAFQNCLLGRGALMIFAVLF